MLPAIREWYCRELLQGNADDDDDYGKDEAAIQCSNSPALVDRPMMGIDLNKSRGRAMGGETLVLINRYRIIV